MILTLAEENGKLFANLIAQKTAVYGEIYNTLTNEQKNKLCELRKTSDHASSNTEAIETLEAQFKGDERSVMRLILSKFFIWVTGLEAYNQVVDTGRPAVYFGFANLRVEDRAGEDVSNGLRSEASKLVANLLDTNQSAIMDTLIDDQTIYLDSYYQTRADLASMIMTYQSENPTIDTNELLSLSVQSEVDEAKLAIVQAKGMGKIIRSLTADQFKVLTDFKAGNGN